MKADCANIEPSENEEFCTSITLAFTLYELSPERSEDVKEG